MNENLNLVEILKDCPKGTKLYSPVYGDVVLVEIFQEKEEKYLIKIKSSKSTTDIFTKDGKLFADFDGECLLFPSKDQRNWSKFKVKKPKFDLKTMKPFDEVLARDADDREWLALLFSHINTKGKVIVAGCAWAQVIPYNEETNHLVGTMDEAPEFYKYWED